LFDDFWKQKIRAHVRRLDINQDGVLTRKDFEDMSDRYKQLGLQSKAKGQQMRAAFLAYWDDILDDYSKRNPVTSEVYIEALINLGEDKIIKYVNAIESTLFDLMDLNNSGFISQREFAHWFKVVGLDPKLAAETYTAIELRPDDTLSREEYMAAVKEFFIGEDQTSPYRLLWGPLVVTGSNKGEATESNNGIKTKGTCTVV